MNVIPLWGTTASLFRLNKAGILFTLSARSYGNANDSMQWTTACNLCAHSRNFFLRRRLGCWSSSRARCWRGTSSPANVLQASLLRASLKCLSDWQSHIFRGWGEGAFSRRGRRGVHHSCFWYIICCLRSRTHNTKRTAGGQMSLSTRRLQTMTGHFRRRCNCQLCICCEFCRARCYYYLMKIQMCGLIYIWLRFQAQWEAASGHIPIIMSAVCIYTFVCFLVYRSEMETVFSLFEPASSVELSVFDDLKKRKFVFWSSRIWVAIKGQIEVVPHDFLSSSLRGFSLEYKGTCHCRAMLTDWNGAAEHWNLHYLHAPACVQLC